MWTLLDVLKDKQETAFQFDKEFKSVCNSCLSVYDLICLKHLVSSANSNICCEEQGLDDHCYIGYKQ